MSWQLLIMVIAAHADSKHKRVQASHYTKVNPLLFFWNRQLQDTRSCVSSALTKGGEHGTATLRSSLRTPSSLHLRVALGEHHPAPQLEPSPLQGHSLRTVYPCWCSFRQSLSSFLLGNQDFIITLLRFLTVHANLPAQK